MAVPTSAPLSTDDAFWADADRHLIRYAGAGAFTREIIDHAAGSFLFAADADLLPVLDAMGLGQARRSPTALSGFGPGQSLSGITQRAAFEVTEEGAEAAAATAIGVARVASESPLHMVVDKPFIYALRDSQSGLIVIAGYVGNAPRGKAS